MKGQGAALTDGGEELVDGGPAEQERAVGGDLDAPAAEEVEVDERDVWRGDGNCGVLALHYRAVR